MTPRDADSDFRGELPSSSSTLAFLSWEWLAELCRPLPVEIAVVDHRRRVVFEDTAPGGGNRLRAALVVSDVLRAALSATLEGGRPRAVHEGALYVSCNPLFDRGQAIGAVVTSARGAEAGHGVSPVRVGALAAWLSRVIQRHVADGHRTNPNLLILDDVLEGIRDPDSDRELLARFAEAMAIWHDIETVACVPIGSGAFSAEVTLASRLVEQRPVLAPAIVPRAGHLERLPSTDLDGWPGIGSDDLLVTTLRSPHARTSWLLAFAAVREHRLVQQLDGYLAVVEAALARMAGFAATRATAAACECWSGQGGRDPEMAVESVLAELSRRLGATAAGLLVEPSSGGAARLVGSRAAIPVPGRAHQGRELVAVRRSRRQTLLLALQRGDGPPFTPLDHRVSEAVVGALAAWVERAYGDVAPREGSREV